MNLFESEWRGALAGRILVWIGTPILGFFLLLAFLFSSGSMLALESATFALALVASILAVGERQHGVAARLG
jgi:hypothetical protein